MTDVSLTGSMGNTARTYGQGWRTVEALNYIRNILRDLATELHADKVLPHPASAVPHCTLAIDANAENIQTGTAVIIRSDGRLYAVAADSEIDISAETAGGDTIADDSFGVIWVYGERGGDTDVETPAAAQDNASLIAALAQNMPSPPSAGAVPIGAVGIEVDTLGGAFTIGTTSLADAAVTDTYYSLFDLPGVLSAMASIALDAGAATFTYGAAVGRLGTGTVITITGKANAVLQPGTVAAGKVGAWRLFALADDVEIAVPVGVAYDTLEEAKDGARQARRNPLLVELGRIFVENDSSANFVGGTTALDAAGITTTFQTLGPRAGDGVSGEGIDNLIDVNGLVNRLKFPAGVPGI